MTICAVVEPMANEQNLKPSEYKLSQEEASRGGKNSGKARRKKKAMRDIALMMGSQDAPPQVIAKLIQLGMIQAGETCTMDEALMLAQYGKALSGNTKAAEFVRDTSGQKPTDKVELTDVAREQSKLDELLKQRKQRNESQRKVQ